MPFEITLKGKHQNGYKSSRLQRTAVPATTAENDPRGIVHETRGHPRVRGGLLDVRIRCQGVVQELEEGFALV